MMSQTFISRNTLRLRPSVNWILRIGTFPLKKEGPRQGLLSDFQWLAFGCPIKRNTA